MSNLVLIPTYNEVENLHTITADVLDNIPETDILVIDDNSTDGTSQMADRLAECDPRIHVLHRPVKNGLGRAYLEGFAWGLEREYDTMMEMDADGSHPATSLSSMLDLATRYDLVIGSRYVSGGATQGWARHREVLSRSANRAISVLLRLGVKDATSGFRAYRSSLLARLDLESVDSVGYAFQIDMTRRSLAAHASIVEHPIVFREREFGQSKMDTAIIREAAHKLIQWWAEDLSVMWHSRTRRARLA